MLPVADEQVGTTPSPQPRLAHLDYPPLPRDSDAGAIESTPPEQEPVESARQSHEEGNEDADGAAQPQRAVRKPTRSSLRSRARQSLAGTHWPALVSWMRLSILNSIAYACRCIAMPVFVSKHARAVNPQ